MKKELELAVCLANRFCLNMIWHGCHEKMAEQIRGKRRVTTTFSIFIP